MRLALAQVDTTVAAVEENEARILAAIDEARRQRAEVVLFPECALVGYPARDLLYDDALVRRAEEASVRIAQRSSDLTVVLGSVEAAVARGPGGRPLRRNVALVLEDGSVRARRAKTLLPNYDVFAEPRWFVPARANEPVTIAGTRTGLLVCEDLWDEHYERKPARELLAAGASLLLALNASPYRVGVLEERKRRARRGVPVAYVNAVGGEDELVFDGGSFVLDANGDVLLELPRFEEAVATVDLSAPSPALPRCAGEGEPEELFRALALGLRDFVRKNRQRSVWLGLSGGVDSALVACIAKEALGPERVHAIALPSRFNDPRSTDTARELAQNLGIDFRVVSIEKLHASVESSEIASLLSGTTGENVQARLRMLVLMAHVNARGGLLLNTSNKTELALGYGTLHGDLAGTLAPIADLTKTQVYALARWYDRKTRAIPRFILERPPSAELADGQVDPFDYDLVSPLVEELVQGTPAGVLVARGAPADEVDRCEALLRSAEHKRRHAPIGLKVSALAFGTGWQVPVTQRRAPRPRVRTPS